MPKVNIIAFTGIHPNRDPLEQTYEREVDLNGQLERSEREFAARLLVFTKQTRLVMNGARFAEVLAMPWAEIEKELDYMAGTIPSSWEMVDVTFTLQQVSRACAQQITRTRFTPMDADIFGSYAMQSMRVEDMSKDVSFHINPALTEDQQGYLDAAHRAALENYSQAINRYGMKPEDARGLMPLDTHCNLVVKFNLRQLVDMLRTRDESLRVQGEYGDVAHQMKQAVLDIWPWSARFFEPKDIKAIKMIEEVAKDLLSAGNAAAGNEGYGQKSMATKLAKAADLIKKA